MDEEIMESRGPEEDVDALRARLAAAETENRLYRLAPGLGVSAAAVPYLARLCPEPGEDDQTARAALEKVLEDLPGLRASSGGAGGFRVGAGAPPAQSDDALIRAAFGIR